jgi:hypothetical protein
VKNEKRKMQIGKRFALRAHGLKLRQRPHRTLFVFHFSLFILPSLFADAPSNPSAAVSRFATETPCSTVPHG